MDYKRLLIQTIPTVGAIGMAACVPSRGGGGGGDDGGGGGGAAGIFGAWELRSYGYEGGEAYEYPTSYTDEYGCTFSAAYFLEVAENLSAAMTGSSQYEGCEYYSEGYVYRYPGAAQDLGTGTLRIVIEDFLTMDCPQNPSGNEMLCIYDDGGSGDDDDSGDDSQAREINELTFQRTNANNIPEPTPQTGDDDDDDSAM